MSVNAYVNYHSKPPKEHIYFIIICKYISAWHQNMKSSYRNLVLTFKSLGIASS